MTEYFYMLSEIANFGRKMADGCMTAILNSVHIGRS